MVLKHVNMLKIFQYNDIGQVSVAIRHTSGNTVFLTGNDIFFRKKGLYDYQTAAYNELITYLHHAANYEATDATRLLQFDIKC